MSDRYITLPIFWKETEEKDFLLYCGPICVGEVYWLESPIGWKAKSNDSKFSIGYHNITIFETPEEAQEDLMKAFCHQYEQYIKES